MLKHNNDVISIKHTKKYSYVWALLAAHTP